MHKIVWKYCVPEFPPELLPELLLERQLPCALDKGVLLCEEPLKLLFNELFPDHELLPVLLLTVLLLGFWPATFAQFAWTLKMLHLELLAVDTSSTICYARATLRDIRCPLCRGAFSGFTPDSANRTVPVPAQVAAVPVPAQVAASEEDDLSALEEETEEVDIDGPPSPTSAVTDLLASMQFRNQLDQANREYIATLSPT